MNPDRLLACIQLASNVPGAKPARIEVMPLGRFTHGGATFTVTEADLQAFAADINARGDKIPIDYDHSFAESGVSLAAGWFVPGSAGVDDGVLTAEVEWTAEAVADIKSGKYRFLSPEFSFKKKDQQTGKYSEGRVMHAAALTNRPFFTQLAPVTASDRSLAEIFTAASDDDMACCSSCGITASDLDNGLCSDCRPIKSAGAASGKESHMKGLAEVYGLKADASEDEILAAARADREKSTTLETKVVELETKITAAVKPAIDDDVLATLRASAEKGESAARKLHELEKDTLLTTAISDGKILPTQKDAYAALFDADPVKTAEHVKALAANAFPTAPIGRDGSTAFDVTDGEGNSVEVITATIEGTEYSADPDSARLDHEAKRILTSAGKLDYTDDEYFAAAIQAQKNLALSRR